MEVVVIPVAVLLLAIVLDVVVFVVVVAVDNDEVFLRGILPRGFRRLDSRLSRTDGGLGSDEE